MRDVFGGHYPALIWKDVMTVVHQDVEPVKFEVPRNIIELRIDIKSGLLPSPYTPAGMIRREVFVEGTQPTEISRAWIPRVVSSEHPNYLFDPACNQCEPETRVFLDRKRLEPYTHPDRAETYLPMDMRLMAPEHYCTVLHGNGDKPPDDPIDDEPPLPPDDPGDDEPAGPVSLELTVRGNKFEPPSLSARRASEITLTIRAEDQDVLFVLPYLDIEQFVPEGTEAVIEMVFERSGRYDYFCNLSYLENPRMFGRIIID